ncbi:MAG: hypothetical protein QGH66_03025 [Dehalococcoidia bacterium]|nr:hypothetical protein [Dehalococcoidia bacterium]
MVRAGVDSIAVINAVLGAPDAERATADLIIAIEEAKNGIQ